MSDDLQMQTNPVETNVLDLEEMVDDSRLKTSGDYDTMVSSLLMYQSNLSEKSKKLFPTSKISLSSLPTLSSLLSINEVVDSGENQCVKEEANIFTTLDDIIEEDNGETLGEDAISEKINDDSATALCTNSSRKKSKKKKRWIGICTSSCRYESVRRMSRKFGMKEVGEDEEWTIFWTDFSVSLERVMEMKRFQKINHFPGMNEICRKDFLARNLNRLHKLFPKQYSCFPKTWCFPADYSDFQAYCRSKKNKTFICKPESGCQGKGIFLTKNPKDIKPGEHMICQQYLTKCLTIDGYKFDFRLYVLVTSCDPLRIFIYKEGLGRFATKKYREPNNNNMDEVCMHLTNYAINKNSDDFIRDDYSGSKRKLASVCQWLEDRGYDVSKMWANIEDVIIKTLISAHPILKHNYRTCFPNHMRGSACFEILGFDVILDKNLKAWVLEVNHSPSFHTDARLDKEVKEGLIYDAFNLLDLRSADRKKCIEEDRRRVKERLLTKPKPRESRREEIKTTQQQYLDSLEAYEDEHMGGYRRIYPVPGSEKYQEFFDNSCSLFQTTTAVKVREEAARAQREEIRIKQEKKDAMLKCRSYRPDTKRDAGEAGGERKNSSRELSFRHRPITRQLAILKSRQRIPEPKVTIDTTQPGDIVAEEELERISGLLERDSLVRSMGIVEAVYRLFHVAAGVTNTQKTVLPQQAAEKERKPLEMSQQYLKPDNIIPPVFISSTFRRYQANSLILPWQKNVARYRTNNEKRPVLTSRYSATANAIKSRNEKNEVVSVNTEFSDAIAVDGRPTYATVTSTGVKFSTLHKGTSAMKIFTLDEDNRLQNQETDLVSILKITQTNNGTFGNIPVSRHFHWQAEKDKPVKLSSKIVDTVVTDYAPKRRRESSHHCKRKVVAAMQPFRCDFPLLDQTRISSILSSKTKT